MKPLPRNSAPLVALGIAFVALAGVGCGGSLMPPGSGTGGSAAGTTGEGGSLATGGTGGTFDGGPGGAGGVPPVACTVAKSGEIPSEHRATAPACKASNQPPAPDGGVPSCTADADCAANTSSLYRYCVHGACSFDQCLTDTDCGSTGVCACSSDYYGGNAAFHPNFCVTANCRLDSDCGPGGYCSPSRGYCGTFQGFYCHTAADTCIDATADCAGCGNACVYSPAVAAFTCGSSICAG
ncbi:MAG TPA: hypothetical protein VGP64_03170 [Polyangia bacterium]|jgi:hypothetical protein